MSLLDRIKLAVAEKLAAARAIIEAYQAKLAGVEPTNG